jgi:hypothetical protein
MINSIIFPAPSPPSYTADKFLGEILYVPRNSFPTHLKKNIFSTFSSSSLSQDNEELKQNETFSFVPCLFLPY